MPKKRENKRATLRRYKQTEEDKQRIKRFEELYKSYRSEEQFKEKTGVDLTPYSKDDHKTIVKEFNHYKSKDPKKSRLYNVAKLRESVYLDIVEGFYYSFLKRLGDILSNGVGGFSEADLARNIGTTSSIVHRWFNGDQNINLDYLLLICDLLNISHFEIVPLRGLEADFLEIWREADDDQKSFIVGKSEEIINNNSYKEDSDTIEKYSKLSNDSKTKIEEMIDLLYKLENKE